MPRGNKFKEKLGTCHSNHEYHGDSRPQTDFRTMHERATPAQEPDAAQSLSSLKRGVYVLGGVN